MDKRDTFLNSLLFGREARKESKEYLALESYGNAIYWIEKLFLKDPSDIFIMASALVGNRSFTDAISVIEKYQAHNVNIMCRSLLADCYYRLENYDQVMVILDSDPIVKNHMDYLSFNDNASLKKSSEHEITAIAAMLTLKGDLYNLKEEYSDAIACYSKALHIDISSTDAFLKMVDRHIMPPSKVAELLESLPVSSTNERLMLVTYKTVLHPWIHGELERKCTSMPPILPDMRCSVCMIPKLPPDLYESIEVQTAEAQFMAIIYNFRDCYALCKEILKKNEYFDKALILYTACLFQSDNTSELFTLGHDQIAARPQDAVPWFISGCYYLLMGEYSNAQAHLTKCINIDKNFGEALLVYGHSFSYGNATDQAFAAYLQAQKLNPRNYVSMLSLGAECIKTPSLGEPLYYLELAADLAPSDPNVLNELGVAHYHKRQYDLAEKCLLRALYISEHCIELSPRWEPLFTNLGFVLWKLKKYDESIKTFNKAIGLNDLNYATFMNIGCVYLEMGENKIAISYLVNSLTMKSDNELAKSLLEFAMNPKNPPVDLITKQLSGLTINENNKDREDDCSVKTKPPELKTSASSDSNADKGNVDANKVMEKNVKNTLVRSDDQKDDTNRQLVPQKGYKLITDMHPPTRFLSVEDINIRVDDQDDPADVEELKAGADSKYDEVEEANDEEANKEESDVDNNDAIDSNNRHEDGESDETLSSLRKRTRTPKTPVMRLYSTNLRRQLDNDIVKAPPRPVKGFVKHKRESEGLKKKLISDDTGEAGPSGASNKDATSSNQPVTRSRGNSGTSRTSKPGGAKRCS